MFVVSREAKKAMKKTTKAVVILHKNIEECEQGVLISMLYYLILSQVNCASSLTSEKRLLMQLGVIRRIFVLAFILQPPVVVSPVLESKVCLFRRTLPVRDSVSQMWHCEYDTYPEREPECIRICGVRYRIIPRAV